MSKVNIIKDRAMILKLSMSKWGARKADNSLAQEIDTKHDGNGIASVSKNLMKSPALEDIKTKMGQIRRYVMENSLPYGDNARRVITVELYYDIRANLEKLTEEANEIIRAFYRSYLDQIKNEKKRLGDTFDDSEYPPLEKIMRKFGVYYQFLPITREEDFRFDLDNEEIKRIAGDFITDKENQYKEAITESWNRLYTVIKKAAETLDDPEAKFKNSLIDNIRKTTAILHKLNFNNDKSLGEMLVNVEKTIDGLDAEDVRHDETIRRDVCNNYHDLLGKIMTNTDLEAPDGQD